MPQFLKEAIFEKQKLLIAEARNKYIQDNQLLQLGDKDTDYGTGDFARNCTSILRKKPDLEL